MLTKLEQFNGRSFSQVLKALREQGLDIIGSGNDDVVLAPPENGTDSRWVVRLSYFPEKSEAFARLCGDNPANPHLPKIYAARRLEGDPPLFMTVMERLQTLDQLPGDKQRVYGGFARALATLVDGHESHDNAHAEMLKNDNVAQAARAIVGSIENCLEEGGENFLYYDSGYSEEGSGPIDSWYPSNVLFRPVGDNKWDIVFSDPFRQGMVRSDVRRDELRDECAAMKARIERLAVPRETPASRPSSFTPA